MKTLLSILAALALALPAMGQGGLSAQSKSVDGVSALFVSGTSTNGATPVATNASGQAVWSGPVQFMGLMTSNQVLSATPTTGQWTEVSDYGNWFDGATALTPVNGIYSFTLIGEWSQLIGASVVQEASITTNGASAIHVASLYTAGVGGYFVVHLDHIYLTNNVPVRTVMSDPGVGKTNTFVGGAPYYPRFSGVLEREMP